MPVTYVKSKILYTGNGRQIPEGMLEIKDGILTAVGQNLPVPEDAILLDYSGFSIFPGLIDASSHLGINKEPFNYLTDTRDGADASDPFTPALLAEDAFDPFSPALDAARAFGITTCFAACGHSNLIDGQGASFKLKKAETSDQMLIPGSRQMNFSVGEFPVRSYAPMKRSPMTRMSANAMLREKLSKARQLLDEQKEETADPTLKALLPVLKREQKARFFCHAAQDLAMAVRFGEEFGLDFTIDGGYEAWKMPDFWKAHPVSFVLNALPFGPMQTTIKSWYDFSLDNAAILAQSGCLLALTADDVTNTARLPFMAGFLTAHGLSMDTALRAVTETPARILGLDKKTGTLEVGKDADFAVWDGHALLSTSRCLASYIEGCEVYRA
ncbi:MAG: amidohydrolase family protein [Eubacteriales bacterium]|nr:amidohydrolase family protein [Eubacteriales bacterium]